MKKQNGLAPIVIILIIVGILVSAGGVYYYGFLNKKTELVVCTQEAKLCPDGSYVGRVGPNCEFATCTEKEDENIILNAQQNQEKAQRMERDFQRIEDIKDIQLALELYFDENNEYPNALAKLTPKFITKLFLDPLTKKPYYYSVHISDGAGQVQKGRPDSYHLGANLEEQENALSYDKDCNSVSGLNCPYGFAFEKVTAFNGFDNNGCGGEIKKYCYDLTP